MLLTLGICAVLFVIGYRRAERRQRARLAAARAAAPAFQCGRCGMVTIDPRRHDELHAMTDPQ